MLNRKVALSIAIAGLFFAPMIASAAPASLTPQVGELSADRQYIYQGGEEGWVTRPHEYGLRNGAPVHTDDRSMTTAAPKFRTPPQQGQISADGQYVFDGNESGWVPRPHEFGPAAGRMVHTDERPMNTPMAATRDRLPPRAGDISADGRYVYRGGEDGWVPR